MSSGVHINWVCFWTGCAMVAEVPFLPALYLTVSRVHLKNNQQIRPEDPQQALSLSPYIHTVLRTPCGKCFTFSQMWKLRHKETKYTAWSVVVKPTVLSAIAVRALQTPRELTNALKKTHPYSWCCGGKAGRQWQRKACFFLRETWREGKARADMAIALPCLGMRPESVSMEGKLDLCTWVDGWVAAILPPFTSSDVLEHHIESSLSSQWLHL